MPIRATSRTAELNATLRPGGASPGDRAADGIAAHLLDWIANARVPLHSRLPPERVLCETLGVGRTTLRQALKTLEEQGRIWRHVGKGTFVGGRPTSVHSGPGALGANTTLTDLIEARLAIEPMVARMAATRAERVDIALIEQYHQRAAHAEDWDGWDMWDDLFHRALAEAADNALMISIVDHMLRIKRQSRWCIRRARKFDPALKRKYSLNHDEIISAVCGWDGAAAEAAMRRHILSISKSLGPALI